MQPQTGERVAHYQLQARLATGGMGVVYRAFDERTKRLVALKVLSSQFGTDPDYRARFAQEAELAARVEHPNIVPIYDVGGYPNLYIAMRLIPGTDLATVLRHGPLRPERVLDIAESVAAALDEAHRNQLVHRDVKPGNVLLAPARDRHRVEHIYLTDFGIARSLASDLTLSQPVVVLGSPAYMAPERLAGEPGGPACDVYGLACVLFECFSGSRPFPPTAPPEEITRRAAVEPPRLSFYRPDLPLMLDEALYRAMSRDPRRRPASAGDLAAAARSAFVARPVAPTAPYPRSAPPGRPPLWSPPPVSRPSVSSPPVSPPPMSPTPVSRPSVPPAGKPAVDPPRKRWFRSSGSKKAAPSEPPPASVPPPASMPPPASAGRPASSVQPPSAPVGAEPPTRLTPRRRKRRRVFVLALLVVLVLAYLAAQALNGPHETARTRALAARLPTAVYGSCAAADGELGVTAAVHCSGTDPRVDAIEVRQVTSTAVLDARFRSLSKDRKLVTRRCAGETGNSGGFWTSGGARQGAFACFLDSSDHRRLLWQYSGANIEISAEVDDDSGTAAKKLYDWWSSEARDRPLSS